MIRIGTPDKLVFGQVGPWCVLTSIERRSDEPASRLVTGPSLSFLAKHLVGVSCVAVLRVPGREVYYLYMASIVGKRQGNATYYYLVESARVDGVPSLPRGGAEQAVALMVTTARPRPCLGASRLP